MNRNIFIFLLFLFSCKSTEKNINLSGPLQKKIREFKTESSCEDARVTEMDFYSDKVYLFEYGSCMRDRESPVYDKDGRMLGALGGFAGNMQIQGKDFGQARLSREIWRKKTDTSN